jgi:chemotaxis protein MotD
LCIKEKSIGASWSGPCFVIVRIFADTPVASIAAMLSTSSNAIVAASSHDDAPDEGFESVLASYTPANTQAAPAVKAAPPKTLPSQSAKPAKTPDRAIPTDTPPVSKKEARADAQTGRKQKQDDSKSDPAVSPTPQAVAAVPTATVVRAGTAVKQTDDDAGGDEDTGDVKVAAPNSAAVPKAAAPKAAASKADAPKAAQVTTPNVLPANDQDAPAANTNIKPAAVLPKPVMDAIVAAAKQQPRQPAPSVTPSSATAPSPAAPSVDQPRAAQPNATPPSVTTSGVPSNTPNIAAMLSAARGTITVTSAAPKQAADKGDAKLVDAPQDADKNTAAAPDATQVQPDANTKLASDDKQPKQDAAQDKSGTAADNAIAPSTSADQPAQTVQTAASQPATPTTPVVAAVAPSAVNAAAPAIATAQDPKTSANDDDVTPNVAALATAIAAKSAAGTKTFDIRMDPPELGRVDVHLSVDRDGKVQAMLSADRPETLALLQRSSQNLEQALKDTGLNLSNNSLNFSLKGDGRQGDGGGASMARTRTLSDAVLARAEAANASVLNMNTASGDGRLDIRV